MPVRLSLLTLATLATLALGACDGQLPAPTQQASCCCRQCPADAAPAAKGPAVSAEAGPAAPAVGGVERVARRVRATPAVRGEVRAWRYATSSEELSGDRYGGVSVSVSETESSSERYSYSESSSGYGSGSASGGGYAYGYGSGYRGGPGDGRVGRHPPHHPGYRLAGTDRDGYLIWPGKVED